MTDDTADPTGRRNTSMKEAALRRLIARDLPFEILGAPA
jgi:hypothetical protein